MRKLSVEEVKEYFKHAKTVRCLIDGKVYFINLKKEMNQSSKSLTLFFQKNLKGKNDDCVIWHKDVGYAQIVSYSSEYLEALEKRVAILENKVDLKKIADMPENPIKLNFGIDFGKSYSHSDVLLPKSIVMPNTAKFLTDDQEYYKVINGGCGALGANNEIGKIVEVKEKPKNWCGSYWDDKTNKHNSELVIKTISGVYWGLCAGFKIEKATDDQVLQAKKYFARSILDNEFQKVKESNFVDWNKYPIKFVSDDWFKFAFDSINPDPNSEINRLKLRIEELEAENKAILAGPNAAAISFTTSSTFDFKDMPMAGTNVKNSLPKLFTGWIKNTKHDKVLAYSEAGILKYGFNANGEWISDTVTPLQYTEIKATESEVSEALKNEAVKRGLIHGNYAEFGSNKSIREIRSDQYFYDSNINILMLGSDGVFDNGSWANVVKTITREEAEKELGKKIV